MDPDMRPHPHRPYGWFKLQQEQDLDGVDFPLVKRIYRVSSAYGRIRSGHRLGLVSNLIHNGVHRRVTQVVGRTNALRDFVFADDIGHYLAKVIQQSPQSSAPIPTVLAVGKPSSIFEIRALVETMLGRRVLVAFQSQAVNDSDITVSRRVMPTDWYPHGLAHGLRCVYEDYLSRGTPLAQ